MRLGNPLRTRILALIERHGSLRAAARVLGVDHAYLSRLSTGENHNPSDDLLRKLGLRRLITYVDANAVSDPPASADEVRAALADVIDVYDRCLGGFAARSLTDADVLKIRSARAALNGTTPKQKQR
jgi:transcriptional regulator with XRE-family HTH domain